MYSSPRLAQYRAKLRLQDIKCKTANNAQTIAFSAPISEEALQTQPQEQNTQENLEDFLTMENTPLCTEVAQDVETSALTPQGEFLRWHHRLEHLSYKKMILLCTLRILSRRLLTVKPPMCAGCKAGAMTRKPTRVKGKNSKGLWKQTTKPGECVSVDQTESRTPGFIGVMRGFLCKQR